MLIEQSSIGLKSSGFKTSLLRGNHYAPHPLSMAPLYFDLSRASPTATSLLFDFPASKQPPACFPYGASLVHGVASL
ncbi:unnamed protein product [Linum trigynum]